MMIIEVKIPSPGESISEVEISKWLITNGDFVRKDEIICEVESEKATLSISSEADGRLNILSPEGETANVGQVICTIDASVKPEDFAENFIAPDGKQPVSQPPSEKVRPVSYAAGHPSPAAGKIMQEQEIKAGDIKATGRNGRITKGDVLNKLQTGPASPKTSSSGTPPELPDVVDLARNTRRVKMSPLRKKISARLVAVKNETAMLTTFNEVDMSRIIGIRARYKEKFNVKHDIKLGFMSFFTRAVIEAIKDFPEINAMVDEGTIVYHDYVDIGIAVSAPKGLVVPVIRNAESMTFAQIESSIAILAKKAHENLLTLEEMSGGTFTITNGGIFGSMLSTPIINPPQSAILGMHNIIRRPVAVGEKVEIRPMMYIAMSYDHQIIDGRESVGFLVRLKELLEDPMRLLLDV